MKATTAIAAGLVLNLLLPQNALAENPSVPCQSGYVYTCNEYGVCGCNPDNYGTILMEFKVEPRSKNDDSGDLDLMDDVSNNFEEIKNDPFGLGDVVLNYEEIKRDIDGALFETLLDYRYTDRDAEFIVGIVRSYGILRGEIVLTDDFVHYFYREGLTLEEVAAVSVGLRKAAGF